MAAGTDTTTLSLVQRLLSAYGLDDISTLGETEDADAVLKIVNRMYEMLIGEFPWAQFKAITTLDSTTTPHIRKIPEAVGQVDWIKYDNNPVRFVSPAFMDDLLRNRDTSESNIDSNGARNDQNPQYWTTNDDLNVIFDSYPTSFTNAKFQVRTVSYPSTELLSDTDLLGLPLQLRTLLTEMCLERIASEILQDRGEEDRRHRDVARLRQHAKRWAQKHNKKESLFNKGYGRLRGSSLGTRNLIDTDRITEGS